MKPTRSILVILVVMAGLSVRAQIDTDEWTLSTEINRSSDIRSRLPDDTNGRFDLAGAFQGSVFKTASVVVERVNDWPDLSPQTVAYQGRGQIEITRAIEPASLTDTLVVRNRVLFYQFRAKPALDLSRQSVAVIVAGGAPIGFRLMAGSDLNGEILVPRQEDREIPESGIETEQEDWVSTGVAFAVGPQGRAALNLDIVIRLDADERQWDLWLNHRLVLTDRSFIEREPRLWIRAASAATGRVSQLRLTRENPLFADRDVDGIPDDFELQVGGSSDIDDRDWVLPEFSRTLIELYRGFSR